MKIIFKKSHIPFIKNTLHGAGTGRDSWTLTRIMQDTDGLSHQVPAEISLLQRGAQKGDMWSVCELARTYFNHCGDMFLPEALRLWKRAVLQNDEGAKWDVQNLPIYDRIISYRSSDGDEYKTMEMRCAMLTEWHLEKFGLYSWDKFDYSTRMSLIRALAADACKILRIPTVEISTVPHLTFNGGIVDALAHWENRIDIREELLPDIERIIELIFHELGHIVAFEIKKTNSAALKSIYGLTDERIRSWDRNEMGYEVPTSEEDPDTLSYGVYTLWGTFFLSV